jgi:hypothetical protein
MVLAVAFALLLSANFVFAADQATTQGRAQTTKQELAQAQGSDQEQIYGNQLMTQQEKDDYRAKMGAAKSGEEQEQIRKQHHEQMQERAKAQGMSLPDMPQSRGAGMGPSGSSMGTGSRGGSGGGMGGGGMGGGGGHR